MKSYHSKKMSVKCVICGKLIKGYRPVGDNNIFNIRNKKIARARWHKGKGGYAHLSC